MKNPMYYLSITLNMNERLFINALDGVTEEQTHERVSGHSNPLCWLAPHTVSARYTMLFLLGKPAMNPYAELFDNFRAYDASLSYPSLEETKAEWAKVSALLKEALAGVSDEHLAADAPFKTPIGDFTNAGTFAFLVQHEGYDLGQMAFLKKYHTKEAMKY